MTTTLMFVDAGVLTDEQRAQFEGRGVVCVEGDLAYYDNNGYQTPLIQVDGSRRQRGKDGSIFATYRLNITQLLINLGEEQANVDVSKTQYFDSESGTWKLGNGHAMTTMSEVKKETAYFKSLEEWYQGIKKGLDARGNLDYKAGYLPARFDFSRPVIVQVDLSKKQKNSRGEFYVITAIDFPDTMTLTSGGQAGGVRGRIDAVADLLDMFSAPSAPATPAESAVRTTVQM